MVATSVCTGCRKCLPDSSTAMGSSPSVICNKKHTVADATLCFLSLLSEKELGEKRGFYVVLYYCRKMFVYKNSHFQHLLYLALASQYTHL